MNDLVRTLDRRLTGWLDRNAVHALRVAMGVVFLWLGALKFVPGMSPAEGLIERTVDWIVDPAWFQPVLAAWESAIGLALVVNRFRRLTLLLLFAHMAGTFMPWIACPELVWTQFPFGWTLEGQYILKNLVLIAGGLTIASRLPRTANRLSLTAWERTPTPTSPRYKPRAKPMPNARRGLAIFSRGIEDVSYGWFSSEWIRPSGRGSVRRMSYKRPTSRSPSVSTTTSTTHACHSSFGSASSRRNAS